MTTARQFINRALKKIGILGVGETISAEEAADGLVVLNDMLDSWSVDGGLVYTDTVETFTLTTAASYTIGSGGDFNTTRPYIITAAYVTRSGGTTDYPLRMYSLEQYARLTDKSTGNGIPELIYYDNNSPLANIYLYPAPASGYTLTLHTRKPLTSFTTLDTDLSFPPGYSKAIVNNLAVDLSDEYAIQPTATLVKNADESRGIVFTANARNNNNVTTLDPGLVYRGAFDIYRGE